MASQRAKKELTKKEQEIVDIKESIESLNIKFEGLFGDDIKNIHYLLNKIQMYEQETWKLMGEIDMCMGFIKDGHEAEFAKYIEKMMKAEQETKKPDEVKDGA